MVELIGDICKPSELIIPFHTDSSRDSVSGIIFISGVVIHFVDATGVVRTISSA